MTDEEKAEEWVKKNNYPYSNCRNIEKKFKEAFLAGLKAGRPQWHDLRKDPNNLPDEGTYLVVLRNDYGYKELFMMYYEEDDEEELHWVDGDCEVQDEHIIAWCEIPTFDKE